MSLFSDIFKGTLGTISKVGGSLFGGGGGSGGGGVPAPPAMPAVFQISPPIPINFDIAPLIANPNLGMLQLVILSQLLNRRQGAVPPALLSNYGGSQ